MRSEGMNTIDNKFIKRQLEGLNSYAKQLGYEVTLVIDYDYSMWLFSIFDENGHFVTQAGYRDALNVLNGRLWIKEGYKDVA
jgi:hypothetical protein